MPGSVQRVGDPNVVGGVIIEGDPTVLVNFRPIATLGAPVTPHPCCGAKGCPPIHCAAITTTTNYTVLVKGRPVVTAGDVDTCGHPRSIGSTNVFIGLA
jgi:uncharacterized Zn-binding protein involved in type VI secretion